MNLKSWVIVLGCAIGIGIGCLRLGGGYDAYMVFFTTQVQTVPAWVHLFLKPIIVLPWPWSWGMMSALTFVVIAWATNWFKGRWWLAVTSAPVVWEIWSGQIEWLVILGLVLSLKALDRHVSSAWMGLAVLLMLSKPWVSAGVVVIVIYRCIKGFSRHELAQAAIAGASILLLAWIIWPDWLQNWAITLRSSSFDSTNGSAWPWGLFAWLAVPGARDRVTLFRRVLAASLLSSPYMRLYHATVLTVLLVDWPTGLIGWAVGWLLILSGYWGVNWQALAWVHPLMILLIDKVEELARWKHRIWIEEPG